MSKRRVIEQMQTPQSGLAHLRTLAQPSELQSVEDEAVDQCRRGRQGRSCRLGGTGDTSGA
jgi:hypothetical protein